MIPSLLSPRRSRRALLAALAALSVTAAGTAFAASVGVTSTKLTAWSSPTSAVCMPATVTASATADTSVDQGDDTDSGNLASMRVRAQGLALGIGSNARALVRFALPATPPLCTMTQAKLRLFASASSGSRTLQALRVNAAWSETGANWGNQPATTGTAATATSGAGYREWTVTSQVASMYSGPNNGFLIRDAAESPLLASHVQQFHSRTAAGNTPELVITFG